MTDQTPPSPGPAEPDPAEQPDPSRTRPADGDPVTAPTQTVPTGKRFRRSSDDKVIAGVCGGLARYFGIDPVIVRIAAVALLFVGGFAAIAYIAAIVFVPEDGESGSAHSAPSRAATVVGIAVLVIAALAAVDNLASGWGWWAGPLIPIAILCGLLYAAGRRLLRNRGEEQPSAQRIAGVALLLIAGCLGAGVLGLAAAWGTAAGGGEIVAGIVIAIGVAMIIASFRGGARWLALPALILALPAGVVAAADIDVEGGMGERRYRPITASDLRPDGYRLGVGDLAVDLRDLDWPSTSPVRLKLDVGVGHAIVYVPEDVCVRAAADAGIGYIDVLGDDAGGIDLRHDAGAVQPRHHPALILDGTVGMGAIEVRHEGVPGHYDRDEWGGHDSISPALRQAGCAGTTA